jgi:hypothetical protein
VKYYQVPPMILALVQGAITALDGIPFLDLAACPFCGGPVKAHDTRQKRFARIIDEGGERDIRVVVKRFHCTTCGRLVYADAPFYPGTRYGAPIIDLCVVLSRIAPFHQVHRMLQAMQLAVDRGTVRNYADRDFGPIPATELFGIPLPLSILHLSTLAFGLDKTQPVAGAELLAACGLPPACRTPPRPSCAGDERNQRNEEKKNEERQSGEP